MTGTIKRGRVDGSWYLRVETSRDAKGNRKRRRETFRGTKKEAQGRLRDLIREAENGGLGEASRGTVADLCASWLATVERRVGTKCFVRYSQIVRQYLIPSFGSLKAAQLRPAHIEAALARWSKATVARTGRPISARSVRHIFDTLKAALRWGVRMESMPSEPD